MNHRFAPLALVGVLAATSAQAMETYTLDSNHSMPVFEVNHLGFSTQRGRFNKATGKISLDRAAQKASVNVTIDANSIDMGLAKWDAAMQEEGFFNNVEFPTITFKGDNFTFDGDKPVAVTGDLTLLGQTHPVRLTIANFTCKAHPMFKRNVCGADLSATIKRSAWGMTKYLPMVGDEVRILIPVEAIKDEQS
ncbi:MAG: polyisoprenoid-binding protein [Zoogloeaceae bacterium]|nr:polyisoprenoid-binding protein [Zoogloeaceae bacterium]